MLMERRVRHQVNRDSRNSEAETFSVRLVALVFKALGLWPWPRFVDKVTHRKRHLAAAPAEVGSKGTRFSLWLWLCIWLQLGAQLSNKRIIQARLCQHCPVSGQWLPRPFSLLISPPQAVP